MGKCAFGEYTNSEDRVQTAYLHSLIRALIKVLLKEMSILVDYFVSSLDHCGEVGEGEVTFTFKTRRIETVQFAV